MAMQNTEINVQSNTYSDPAIVPAGFQSDTGQAGSSPVFYTLTNSSGLLKLATDGHFGENTKDSKTKEIVSFSDSYDRVVKAFGQNNEIVTADGVKKPTLLIVESIKLDGRTIPSRVYQAEVVSPSKEGENSSLKIIGSINLRDGTPAQTIEKGPVVTLDDQGKLTKEAAKDLREQIDYRQVEIASSKGTGKAGETVDDPMQRALAQARSDYKPKSDQPEGVAMPSALPMLAAMGKKKSGEIAA